MSIPDNQPYLTLVSSFAGAFFAFIFVNITAGLGKVLQRKEKHQRALVLLERACNQYLNENYANIWVIEDFLNAANQSIASKYPFVYPNEMFEIEIKEQIGDDLANLEIINDLFALESSIGRANASSASTNRFYKDIKGAFISKNIDLPTYLMNVEILSMKLKELSAYLEILDNDIRRLAVKVRVLIREERTIYSKLRGKIFRLTKNKLTAKQRKLLKNERFILDGEIQETASRSKTRIDNITKQYETS